MKLKNILIYILVVCFAMLSLAGCAMGGTAASEGAPAGAQWYSMIMIVAIFAIMYFLMIRPENKRKKKAEEMRNSIEVGDKITTIGGMVGKVVHVTNDRITFETGEDRVRIEVTKWAVSSNDGKGTNKDSSDSEETLNS